MAEYPNVGHDTDDTHPNVGHDTDDTHPNVGHDTDGIQVLPVPGIGEVRPGDDLAELIATAGTALRDDDILLVTSKIVSKAEGRLIEAPSDPEKREAVRQAAVDAEAVRVVASRGRTRIVATRHGLVLAAAGIDASNVDPEHLVLLPVDPDASARRLRAVLADRLGVRVAVVVTDTMGRTWRTGQTDVAIGAAGLAPLRDHRGSTDPYGNHLSVTAAAVIDELAAAGDLVKGKTAGIPVAIVRGLGPVPADDGPGATALVRPSTEDMFALGTAEARAAGRREVAAALAEFGPLAPTPVPAAALRRVVGAVRAGTAQPEVWRYIRVHTPPARRALAAALSDTGELPEAGATLLDTAPELLVALRTEPVLGVLDAGPYVLDEFARRMDGLTGLREVLAAEGLTGRQVLRSMLGADAVVTALALPADWTYLATVAIGYPAEPAPPPAADPGDALLER